MKTFKYYATKVIHTEIKIKAKYNNFVIYIRSK